MPPRASRVQRTFPNARAAQRADLRKRPSRVRQRTIALACDVPAEVVPAESSGNLVQPQTLVAESAFLKGGDNECCDVPVAIAAHLLVCDDWIEFEPPEFSSR